PPSSHRPTAVHLDDCHRHRGAAAARPSSSSSTSLTTRAAVPAGRRRNSLVAMAVAEDIRTSISGMPSTMYGHVDDDDDDDDGGVGGGRTNDDDFAMEGATSELRATHDVTSGTRTDVIRIIARTNAFESSSFGIPRDAISQIPSVLVACAFVFMLGIPFGAAFFPTELILPGKDILGLRIKFDNCVGVQMVENVPFYLELSRISMSVGESGKGGGDGGGGGGGGGTAGTNATTTTISTLFFLFGSSSVIVGIVFYLLGRFELGRVLYFFPRHVLVGCIGGIGLFIVVTSLEVSTNTTFSFTIDGIEDCVFRHIHLLLPIFAFESLLRLLMRLCTTEDGSVRYPLLGPIYYCSITPAFYAILHVMGITTESAEEMGYFFPPLISSSSDSYGGGGDDLFRIFEMVDFRSISWAAVIKSMPTLLGLTAFSLIHVPINIPAFAISTNVEPDMNVELIAHGYSNAISGLFGGLQNYLAYSPSVVYYKSQGNGKRSSLSIVAITIVIFIYGPTIASYVPRCMAGTLLLHLGIDLFLEGAIESYGDYDTLEYSGICLIMIVMVTVGMDQALVAGLVAALSTYVAQSIVYQDPIRGTMTGARLRSSAWNRSIEAQRILQDPRTGRESIYVVFLQGHIFFGNVVNLAEDMKRGLHERRRAGNEPVVVILDFSNVLGVDSSAAQSIVKLKSFILKNFNIKILLFVTGNKDGFLCSYNLSQKVVDELGRKSIHVVEDNPFIKERRMSMAAGALSIESHYNVIADIPSSQVFETIDDALIFAEDVLIALEDPTILQTDSHERFPLMRRTSNNINEVMQILETLMPEATENETEILADLLTPEQYQRDDVVWKQGDSSESLKVVVSGTLISLLEDEASDATGSICPGAVIGELGLVNGIPRMTTVKVLSEDATLYSLSREKWQLLTDRYPKIARYIDMLVIRYLFHRVQHVSNNVFERRSLPV
ncbi:hypothetical protein ACHAXA_001017, partial [Cyclostephanos tholiformis]